MFRWLFGDEITRDEAIRLATEFALAEWRVYTTGWPADEAAWPYDAPTASLGNNYWYVRFPRRTDGELISTSSREIEVWVDKRTGEADHDHNIYQRSLDSNHRGR